MTPPPTPYLTLVVPAYKEEKTISGTLLKLDKVLKNMGLSYEIICVVDGVMDKTYEKAKKVSSPNIHVLSYQINRGKGHAVRFGMARAKGNIIGFIDANGINPDSLPMLYQHFIWYSADIVVGSKRHPASKVVYPIVRKVLSRISQIVIKLLLNINVTDTQVGIKLFKRDVIKSILPRVLVKDWAFDVELLAVAHYLGFKKIYEAPVELELSAKKETSAVISKGLVRAILLAFKDTLAVFYRLKIKHYYDDSNSDNWRRNPDLEFWQPKYF
ncbi:MAG: dolichol-phosphate mannosyltransferase [Microgenomates group bacterium Gr01-1014_16]|nr:MAG: dolichol-phosphate mannosyltransferase [Microgenomates group bacterium Gr01-1014_16]